MAHQVLNQYLMKKTLALAVGLIVSLWSVSATTFLYDTQLPGEQLPPGVSPWMTLGVEGDQFTFTIPETTTSPLLNVYFSVSTSNLEAVTVSSGIGVTRWTPTAGLYNLAVSFGTAGVGPGTYALTISDYGTLVKPVGGYYSVAEFQGGTWVADCPIPVPDAGSTIMVLGISLLGLSQAKRYLR